MSTVDPVAARLQRQNHRPGAIQISVALALQFVGGLVLGYGLSSMLGGLLAADREPTPIAIIAFAGGIPLTIVAGIVWVVLVFKSRNLGISLGWAVFWLGAGLGALICARQLNSSITAGAGAGCWALGIGFLALASVTARSRTRLLERQKEIMCTGEPVAATVSDKGYVTFREGMKILTTVTFTFTDVQGTQRWVQRPMVIHAENPVVNGQETQLWYDRSDPGNDTKIVVKLAAGSPLR